METLLYGVKISIISLGVVFVVAFLLQWLISFFVYLDQRLSIRSVPGREPAGDELSPELVAVISAAVAVALDKKVRIKHIRYRYKEIETMWTVQGRAMIMASHTIKR
jgi:hypothetical protein